MEKNVGLEVLQHLKAIESLVGSVNDKIVAKFAGFWVMRESCMDPEFNDVLPLIRSLEEAGWVEAEVERGHNVRRTFRHADLDEQAKICVNHKASIDDEIQGLMEKQKEIHDKINQLNEKKYEKEDVE